MISSRPFLARTHFLSDFLYLGGEDQLKRRSLTVYPTKGSPEGNLGGNAIEPKARQEFKRPPAISTPPINTFFVGIKDLGVEKTRTSTDPFRGEGANLFGHFVAVT